MKYKDYLFILIILIIFTNNNLYNQQDVNLKFVIWKNEIAHIVSNNGIFKDGDFVSLSHKKDNFDFTNDLFTVELIINNKIYKKSFKTDSFDNIITWVIADPLLIENNPTITDEFLKAIYSLPAGKHLLLINFKVNENIIQRGNIFFISDGKNNKYRNLINNFRVDIKLKNIANKDLNKEIENLKNNTDKIQIESFIIYITNKNPNKTFYLLITDDIKRRELKYEIKPSDIITLELECDKKYNIYYFCCEEKRGKLKFLNKIDQKWNNKTIIIK